MRKLRSAGMLAVLSACLVFAGVKTDFDRSTNFERYQTYSWKLIPQNGTGTVDNGIVAARIQNAVNREFQNKGIRLDGRNPDAYLTYRIGAHNEQSVTTFPRPYGYGWGRWGRWGRWGYGGYGGSDVMVNNYVAGTIVLNLVDAKTNRLLWYAVLTNTGDNAVDLQSEKQINKLVSGAFKKFPPKA